MVEEHIILGVVFFWVCVGGGNYYVCQQKQS